MPPSHRNSGPPSPDESVEAARCGRCAYTLEGLPSPGACPECGTRFDLGDPRTFIRRPPFLRWWFWAPGLGSAIALGAALFCILAFAMGNWGWAMWVVTPISAGVVLGYRVRARGWALVLSCLVLLPGLITALVTLNLAGFYCGLVLGILFIGPVLVGAITGAALRGTLKASSYSQRAYLPVLLGAAALPLICGAIEGPGRYGAPETVVTSRVVEAPIDACWDGIVYYEEVTHPPPLILRLGLAHPLNTRGPSRQVGDTKTCVYNKGWITKRITECDRPTRLGFEVLDHKFGYERDLRLHAGAFEFRDAGEGRTEIRLSTTYRPRLGPRFAWRPFERYAVHTLHRHVIEGIRRNAAARRPALAEGAP